MVASPAFFLSNPARMIANFMYSVTITVTFDAAHRIEGHEGKCKHLHGHTYKAEITVRSFTLDAMSMVIDFGPLKKVVKDFIDTEWDHKTILNVRDPLYDVLIGNGQPVYTISGKPTAERLAEELFDVLLRKISVPLPNGDYPGYCLGKVRIWETPTSYAEWSDE